VIEEGGAEVGEHTMMGILSDMIVDIFFQEFCDKEG
jgi:hypothetical protein